MAKLLKHFGLGYGNNKKPETFDFRAKTLPASRTDRDGVRVVADTSRTPGRRNMGGSSHTVDCGDGGSRNATSSLHSSRRASHETFRTMPARGPRAHSERDWSLRSTKNREPLQHAGTFSGRDSELSGYKKRCISDAKDLRRSLTTDEILSRNASSVAPAVRINLLCGYSSGAFLHKRGILKSRSHTSIY